MEEAEANWILDIVETIIVYKLPSLGREEIRNMLGMSSEELKKSKFYQEVWAEGREKETLALVLRLVKRRFNAVEDVEKIKECEALIGKLKWTPLSRQKIKKFKIILESCYHGCPPA